jgi:hypothetical protein
MPEIKVISCEMERMFFCFMLSWRGPGVKSLGLLVIIVLFLIAMDVQAGTP